MFSVKTLLLILFYSFDEAFCGRSSVVSTKSTAIAISILSSRNNKFEHVRDYLNRYGYFNRQDGSRLTIQDVNFLEFILALNKFQEYYKLEITKTINDETLKRNVLQERSNFVATNKQIKLATVAFQLCEKYANINFQQSFENPNIIIFFKYKDHLKERDSKRCGFTLDNDELAHTFFPPADNSVSEIHINQNKDWNEELYDISKSQTLKKIIDNMENAKLRTSKSGEKKIILYSVHDINVASVLSLLRVFETHFLKFNSFVSVELYQQAINNNHYVKLLHYRDIFTDAQVLSIPSCNVLCNFTSVKNNLEPNVPLNYIKVFRHGSRIPDRHESYVNDPHTDIYEREGYGQLTSEGKRESYLLGKVLRSLYHDFLGEEFHIDMVTAKSTDWDRTKMTAMLVLAGLFPPYNANKWSNELNWIPIPIAYNKFDFEIRKPIYCPTYVEELNRVLNSKEALNLTMKYNKTFETASMNIKKNITTLRQMFLLNQSFLSKKKMNLTIPDWASKELDNINHLATMQSYFENYNLILKKLNGGRFLSKVLYNMKSKIENTLQPYKRKIYLYCGHDNNIVNILSVLNLYNFEIPNYNAAISIELHQNSKAEYFVKILFIRDLYKPPKVLPLHKCGYNCDINIFETLLTPYLPLNFTKDCESSIPLD
ncbi:hypothetical protein FQA39_LY02237 [Lamprigera yunnana]|nr:hypothetical protein FQA39_LY02237 [Lamprigera yunnana]